ncbi:zinc transporter ZIP8-like isoform X2 [Cimex lectularius]|uniref:Zinc transporter n=1 Tax=Cimex lectularius TaxID=79782 RepID=A0A8I6S4V3_CIMLE|nr:zinc transporter ZIP8-like isoform X2 [Cimex lectularius]
MIHVCTGVTGNQNESSVMTITMPADEQKSVQEKVAMDKPTQFEVWCMGLVSVGIVSLSGLTGAALFPIINSPLYGHVMTALIGLAVGSLTSTALFQLIPEAFQLSTLVDRDQYLKTALFGWLSIWGIFVVESLSKIILIKQKKQDVIVKSINEDDESAMLKENHLHLHEMAKPKRPVAGVAWMIIFGDGIHNFIDGVTIGAGYSQSIPTGLGLSIAIACEEYPHELGDFAILLKAGMSFSKAIIFNFLSACTAFVGLVLGIVLGELEEAHYIFAFAGGVFLYVSLTHLIPELKEMQKMKLKKGRNDTLVFFCLQNIGMITGSCIIYLVTKYNEKLTNLF